MRHQSLFASLLYFLHISHFMKADNSERPNIRKSSHKHHVSESKGFANFRPLPEESSGGRLGNGRRTIDQNSKNFPMKDYSGKRMSTQPRSRNELESCSQATTNVQQPLRKRKVEVRNLTFQRCGNGGTQYVVQCTVGSEEHCHHELRRAHAVIVNELPNSDFFVVCVDTDEEKALLETLTDVVDMEEDYIRSLSHIPELTKPVDRRELQGGQQIPYGVDMVNAPQFWQTKGDRGGSAKVCIIDTGLNVGHEDMQGATVSGNTDNDVVSDWDSDDAGHGTHVAGTIAAVDNDVGVVGVAPEAELVIVRVFEGASSQFTASSLVAAMDKCRKEGADVINMSLGGPSSSMVERNKINQLADLGIQLIAASGNSGDTSNPEEYPASYERVVSVGAVNQEREIASFSTHNSEVDISAPGVDILSLVHSCSSCYSRYSGTSMAAPHVSGVFALLMSKYPSKSISEIREAIEESAADSGACGIDRMYGHGIIDAMAAAEYLENGSSVSEQSGCINTKVIVRTDKWGSEISYIIRNSDGEIVYKNGPYTNQIKTYTDTFQLPDDCYEFELVDSYGDGICCEEGSGYFKVEFDGVEEVFNESFVNGNSAKADFGCGTGGGGSSGEGDESSPICGNGIVEGSEECDDGNNDNNDSCRIDCTLAVSPVCGNGIVEGLEDCDDGNNSNTDSCTNECRNARCGDGFVQASLGEECDDGNGTNADGCSSDCKIEGISTSCQPGEVEVQLFFQADAYSYNENEMYFYEAKGQTSVEDIDFIWIGTLQGIESNKKYELSACVDETKCYRFYFFDNNGDGLWGSDGLRLSWNDVDILSIAPYEVGVMWEEGPTVYWSANVGVCP